MEDQLRHPRLVSGGKRFQVQPPGMTRTGGLTGSIGAKIEPTLDARASDGGEQRQRPADESR